MNLLLERLRKVLGFVKENTQFKKMDKSQNTECSKEEKINDGCIQENIPNESNLARAVRDYIRRNRFVDKKNYKNPPSK